MTFWDTSAIVPLLLAEPRSADADELWTADPLAVVWWGTPVECASALARREREGSLARHHATEARRRLKELRGAWIEVRPVDDVRHQADLLVRRHPLRAADALQLGAALVWASGRPDDCAFATFDGNLARAAHGEGFALAFDG